MDWMMTGKEEGEFLARLVIELSRLRQDKCGHLCIENYAPSLLAELKWALADPQGYLRAHP